LAQLRDAMIPELRRPPGGLEIGMYRKEGSLCVHIFGHSQVSGKVL